MKVERGNVRNQFLVSSVLVPLYAVTKVLGQIWGPLFARPPPAGGTFLRLWFGLYSCSRFDVFCNLDHHGG